MPEYRTINIIYLFKFFMKIRLLNLFNDIYIAYRDSGIEHTLLDSISLYFVRNFFMQRHINIEAHLPRSQSFFQRHTEVYLNFSNTIPTPDEYLSLNPNITPLNMAQYVRDYETLLSELLPNNLTLSHEWYHNPYNYNNPDLTDADIPQNISEFIDTLTFSVVNGNNHVVLTLAEFFNTATPLW